MSRETFRIYTRRGPITLTSPPHGGAKRRPFKLHHVAFLKLALALLWERRGECPGAVPVLVCHDEVVVECDAEQAADAKAGLEKAMIEGMDAVLKGTDEVDVAVGVEARIARRWGESG